ncbi:MAG: hypothetical protein K2W95_31400 [Candidatus Obscuribacterales bacterium]|nr:hypothetical protein [Candidatus Obscuribacterales bacterium]
MTLKRERLPALCVSLALLSLLQGAAFAASEQQKRALKAIDPAEAKYGELPAAAPPPSPPPPMPATPVSGQPLSGAPKRTLANPNPEFPRDDMIPEFGKPLPTVQPGAAPYDGPGFAGGQGPGVNPDRSVEESRLGRLEQLAFGNTYPEHDVEDRLDHLESEVFGTKSSTQPVEKRLGSLEAKLGTKSAFGAQGTSQPPAPVSNIRPPSPGTGFLPPNQTAYAPPPPANLPPQRPPGGGFVPPPQQQGSGGTAFVPPAQAGGGYVPPAPQQQGGYMPPRQQGGYLAPQQQGGYLAPQQQGGYMPPQQQGGYMPPQQQGGYVPPQQQGGYMPPQQQGGYMPPQQQGGYMPPQQQGGYMPPQQQGGYMPPQQQGGYMPPQQQGGYLAPQQQGGYMPPQQQGGYMPPPQMQSGYNSPPQQGGYLPPQQQQVGGYVTPRPGGNDSFVQPAARPSVPSAASGNSTAVDQVVSSIPEKSGAGDYFSQITRFDGACARWTSFPVMIHFPGSTPENWRKILDGAVAKWNQYLPVRVASPSEPADIELAWINHLPPRQLGLTNLEVFNGRMRVTVYLLRPTYYLPTTPEKTLSQVALHELGHALGLFGHSANAADVMAPTEAAATKELANSPKSAGITPRDLNTLKRVYQSPSLPAGYQTPHPYGWSLRQSNSQTDPD